LTIFQLLLVTAQLDLDQNTVVKDLETYNLDIVWIQETKSKGETNIETFKSTTKEYTYYRCKCTNSHHGVGFFINSKYNCKLKPVSNRLALLTVYINYGKDINKFKPIHIINAYAPTLETTKSKPQETEQFYNSLEQLIKSVNSKETIICGDFNAKTGGSYNQYPQNIGKYGSGKTNENGDLLIETIVRNNFYLCNTFFKHKLENINTWTSNFTPKNRRNPIRNQIDYVIAPLNFKSINLDSKAVNGYNTSTDHKLVVSIFNLNNNTRKKIYKQTKPKVCQSVYHLRNCESKYDTKVYDRLEESNIDTSNTQEAWKKLTEICIESSISLQPKTNKTKSAKFNDVTIQKLSEEQKHIRLQIDNSQNIEKIKNLKKKRNVILKTIHKEVKKQQEEKLINEIEDIEKCKNDSQRMFKAIKVIQKKKSNGPILIKNNQNEFIGNTKEKIKIISEHFKKTFQCVNPEPIPDIKPQKLKDPFTEFEVIAAIKSLKNNKSPGCDNLKAENLKYAPSTCICITKILNNIAETGIYPKELKQGLLVPLQKPGKPRGPPENLRPVILLSTLRKILAICVIHRIRKKVDEHIIPATQAAYSAGRNTTELVFTFKILAEKAVSSCGYNINFLLLDMSKAFDTIQRGTLIKDLKGIIEDDELHLIVLLLDKVQFSVKLENNIGDPFITNIGSPQGDGASALFFIIYLALSLLIFLNKQRQNNTKELSDHNYNQNQNSIAEAKPKQLEDHTYCKSPNNFFTVDQQYADDIGWASTGIHILEQIEKDIPKVLKERNLNINDTKTEKFVVNSSVQNTNWRECKYVGSLLGTNEDIKRRTELTNIAYSSLKTIFNSKKVNEDTKLRIFNALLESIFLYNSEVWGLTNKQENKIDVFQRRLLRNILNIRWRNNNWISNKELYEKTKQTEWSKKIKYRRLRFLGHVARLDEKAPAKLALYEALRPCKKPRGRPVTTLLNTLKKDLKNIDISNLNEAINCAQDRELWRERIFLSMST